MPMKFSSGKLWRHRDSTELKITNAGLSICMVSCIVVADNAASPHSLYLALASIRVHT